MGVLKKRARVRHIKTNLVFYSGRGTRIGARNLMRAWYAACGRAGISDLWFHDLRRTFETKCVRCGVNPVWLRRLMRHKDFSVIDRYVKLDAENLRDAVDILDRENDKKMTMEDFENQEAR